MNSQDILNLQEAYLSVYNLDEAFNSKGEFIRDNPSTAPDRPSKPVYPSSPLPNRPLSAAEREENKTQEQKKKDEEKRQNRMKLAKSFLNPQESYEIINYLVNEGYAETPEAAEAIMVNMSEDWKKEVKGALIKTGKYVGKKIAKSTPAKKLKRFAKYTTLGVEVVHY